MVWEMVAGSEMVLRVDVSVAASKRSAGIYAFMRLLLQSKES